MNMRLDSALVDLGHFPTRAKARAAIMAGIVFVDGKRIDKAGTPVSPDACIEVQLAEHPYVSRGGQKLEWALDQFAISVEGKRCLDVGASTGGFTDCLLRRGASEVIAVDVGYGQLAWKLRQDPRVRLYERMNFRHTPAGFFQGVSLATVDVSFISVLKILPALETNILSDADAVVLIKPQFEAGRAAVGKGSGVIKDAKIHRDVLQSVTQGAASMGWYVQGLTYSPITGPSGNIEFFVWWRRGAHGHDDEIDREIESVVHEAHGALSRGGRDIT